MVPPDSDHVSRQWSYSGARSAVWLVFVYGTVALYGARFHALRLTTRLVTAAGSDTIRTRVLQPPAGNACPLSPAGFGLFPVRSPLLRESRLISIPPGTEMFHFPGLSSRSYSHDCSRCLLQDTAIFITVGYPIRTSTDQRQLAPPRGLSQLATSFFNF